MNQEFIDLMRDFLPATVLAAIVLFLAREILASVRARSQRKRKLRAIKLLLAEELEKNNWALKSMFSIIGTLKDTLAKHPNATYRLLITRNGSEHFRIKDDPDQEFESGQAIPLFTTETYRELLPTLAEIDKNLFETVRISYEHIAEIAHYRQTMVDFLAGEELAPEGMTLPFLFDLAEEQQDYFSRLNECYRALTKKDLKAHRLR